MFAGSLVGCKPGGSDEDAGEGEGVEKRVLSAVLDPGVLVDADDVAGGVVGDGEPREGEEPGKEEQVDQYETLDNCKLGLSGDLPCPGF